MHGQGQSRRFYQTVGIAAGAPIATPGAAAHRAGERDREGYRLLLDGKPLRTPAKGEFAVPTRALAEAIAAEWQAQGDDIDPHSLPLTRLANSAIDGVAGQQAQVRAEIVKYLASDLVCYRADAPSELVRRQAEAWDPILHWCEQTLGFRLAVTQGVMPVAQPEAAGALLEAWLKAHDAFALAALSVMTTLMGSAVLAVARAKAVSMTPPPGWRPISMRISRRKSGASIACPRRDVIGNGGRCRRRAACCNCWRRIDEA